jgi:hypothetical protein
MCSAGTNRWSTCSDLPIKALFGGLFFRGLKHTTNVEKAWRCCSWMWTNSSRPTITMAYAIGDELLIAFGNRVRDAVRETDHVARFGGNKFVVLLTMLNSPAAAGHVAQKIVQSVTRPIDLSGIDYVISTSVGDWYWYPKLLKK